MHWRAKALQECASQSQAVPGGMNMRSSAWHAPKRDIVSETGSSLHMY